MSIIITREVTTTDIPGGAIDFTIQTAIKANCYKVLTCSGIMIGMIMPNGDEYKLRYGKGKAFITGFVDLEAVADWIETTREMEVSY